MQDAESSRNAFTEVSRRVTDTEKLVFEVDNAIHEQKTGAGQVLESLRIMNEVTAKVSEGSKEMGQGNEAMLKAIDALQKSAGEITTNMEEMFKGIMNINEGAHEVSNMAVDTKSSIQKISRIADGFTV